MNKNFPNLLCTLSWRVMWLHLGHKLGLQSSTETCRRDSQQTFEDIPLIRDFLHKLGSSLVWAFDLHLHVGFWSRTLPQANLSTHTHTGFLRLTTHVWLWHQLKHSLAHVQPWAVLYKTQQGVVKALPPLQQVSIFFIITTTLQLLITSAGLLLGLSTATLK